MSPDSYKQALKKAQSQLAAAVHQRDRWTMEIGHLQQLVKSLAARCERNDKAAARAVRDADIVGIQELILTCVRMSPSAVTAKDVKLQLEATGYTFRFANPLAVIHGALKRLEKAGKIKKIGPGYQRTWLYERETKDGLDADDFMPVE